MIFKVFAIFDSKVEAYLQPFLLKSKGEAIRAITALCDDPQHNFSKYASDFTLFDLGTWDDATAKFDLLITPYSLGVLQEFKKVQPISG